MKEAIPGSVRSTLSPMLQELIERLDVNFVEPDHVWKKGVPPLHEYTCGAWEAFQDFITVRTSIRQLNMYDTQDYSMLHELTHWTGHPSRLNRPNITNSMRFGGFAGPVEHNTEEMTADMGAMKLGKALGIDMSRFQRAHQIYSLNHPHANLNQAECDSDAAVAYILEKAYGYVTPKSGLTDAALCGTL